MAAAPNEPAGLEAPVVKDKPNGLVPRSAIWILLGVLFVGLVGYAVYDINRDTGRRKQEAKKAPPTTIGVAPSPEALAKIMNDQARGGPPDAERAVTTTGTPRVALVVDGKSGGDSRAATAGSPVVPSAVAARAGADGRTARIDLPIAPGGQQGSQGNASDKTLAAHAELQARITASSLVAIAGKGRAEPARARDGQGDRPEDAEAKAVADMKAIMGAVPDIGALLSQVGAQRGGPEPGSSVSNAARDVAWMKDAAATKPAPVTYAANPPGMNLLLQGTRIPAVTLEAMNSDIPGQITARSTEDIRDSLNQVVVIVPAGTRFVGNYNSDISPGQSRVLIAFTRMILPDGRSVELHASQAADAIGQAGVSGDVNNHFFKMYANALAVAIAGERVGDKGVTPSATVTGAVQGTKTIAGEVLAEIAKRTLDRNSNIPPTITTPVGERIYISIARDIALTPWRGQLQ